MTPSVALLDANVLYPAPLRDILLQLAFAGIYQARWSDEIAIEWRRSLIANRPELAERIDRTRAAMLRAFPDALVTDYALMVASLTLPDPDDRHVLAAAVRCAAEVIVTFNIKDFPPDALAPFGIVAQHPDVFLHFLAVKMPRDVLACVRQCVARLSSPPVTVVEYLAVLRRLGLMETAEFLDVNRHEWQP
jgi:predicted nucleic acid-binding protein